MLTTTRVVKSPRNCAFIIVDPQVDFGMPYGSLYVNRGEEVVPELNSLRETLELSGRLKSTFLTKDCHPPDHVSFSINNPGSEVFNEFILPNGTKQMMWPPHCQPGTPGYEFIPGLVTRATDVVIYKGTNPTVDSYSGFGSEDGKGEVTPLHLHMNGNNIKYVFIGGLAFDYCVSYTARDAAKHGYTVCVVRSATEGITAEGCEREESLMRKAGVLILENVDAVEDFLTKNS